MDLPDEMFRAMMLNNMNWIASFHNHINVNINQTKNELPQWDEINESDRKYWAHVYENEFPKKLRQTCFLMMFGHLEEMLILLRKEDKIASIELGRGFGFSKYKPHIKYCLGGKFETSTDYLFIANAQEIRNCLLHAAGRISMMKESEKVKRTIDSSKGLFHKKTDRVEISKEALLTLQNSINGLLTKMHDSILERRNA
jgi:hypothetical protein